LPELSFKEQCLKAIELSSKKELAIFSKTRALKVQNKSFRFVLDYFKHSATNERNLKQSSASLRDTNVSALEEIVRLKEKPIIVVPNESKKGNVCLKNIRQLLVDGKYIDPEELEYATADRKVEVQREIGNYKIVFEVVDDVTNFKDMHWKRLVAVFVSGSK